MSVTAFPELPEVVQRKRYAIEMIESRGIPLQLAIIDKATTPVHRVYREATEERWKPWEPVHAFVTHDPSSYQLKKYGVEGQRDVMVHFSTAQLDDKGLLPASTARDTFLLGARILFDEVPYVVESQHRGNEGYFLNTNIPFYIVVTCKRPRVPGPDDVEA